MKMKLKDLIKHMYATARICIFDAEFNSQVVYRGESEYTPDEYLDREIRLIDNGTTHVNIILEYKEGE